MKIEKSLILIYLGVGIVLGYLSSYFSKSSNLIVSVLLPIAIYSLTFPILIKFIKHKKRQWLFTNSFVTFILVWLVAWIFFFNL